MKLFRLITLTAGVALAACSEPLPKGPAKSVKSYPNAADRYARLLRRQLSDSDPVDLQQELSCEQWRLSQALGVDDALLRVAAVRDTVLAAPDARAAHARVQRMVAGRSYEVGGALCDSLNVIADREDPIVKVDTTRPRRDSTH